MKIYQSTLFENQIKKLHENEKEALDKNINKIIENPLIGTRKKGDLKDIFVHKFKFKVIQYLIAYRFDKKAIELITFGTHENYYRSLKKYLK